jgi:hypothetical protein
VEPVGTTRADSSHDVLEEVERRLGEIADDLSAHEALVEERDRLLRARAALLGEPPPIPQRGDRGQVTQDDVASFLYDHPGSRAGAIAAALGADSRRISAHLYRGKGERFVAEGGRWRLNETESGGTAGRSHGLPRRPAELAVELGIDERTLRSWLRREFRRRPEAEGTEWWLTRNQVLAARARWRGNRAADRDEGEALD